MDYLWIYFLSGIATVSLIVFLLTFSKDIFYTKKLKLNKSSLVLNCSLLLLSILSISLIIYLFISLREQISLIN